MEEEKNVELEEVKDTDSKKKKWWKYALIALGLLLIIILIIVILKFFGNDSKKYKIKIHYGDDVVEVDSDFKLSDLEVDGGKVSFLVDSDGHIIGPDEKLDPKKEYSAHIIHEGKETVKVTYINGDWKLTVEYEKGAGLLFPADPVKEGYVFIGWKDLEIDDYPIFMMPVMKDMTVHAQFEKSVSEGGKCTLNCDTNNDGTCDLNCDLDGDGKPDKNIDKDGDGECDLNCDLNHDGNCDYKCDTDGDGQCDKDCDIEWRVTSGVVWDVKCDGFHAWYAVQCTKTHGTCLSLTVDGEQIEPVEEVKDEWVRFDWSEYVGSGKSFVFDAKYWQIDKTGQKYYYQQNLTFEFEGNCEEPEPSPSPSPSTTPDDEPEYTCQKGYTLKGTKCIKTTKETIDADVTYVCEDGYRDNGNKCTKTYIKGCRPGYTDDGNGCSKIETKDPELTCGNSYRVCGNECCDPTGPVPGELPRYECTYPWHFNNERTKCTQYVYDQDGRGCYSGGAEVPGSYDTCEIVKDKTAKYSCKDGYNLEGTKCTRTVTDTKNAMKVN